MIGAIISKVQEYLDAAISSRAPSSTALSTATWTGTLASNLTSRVDAAISTRAASATALSTAQWTNNLATQLGLVTPQLIVKAQASGVAVPAVDCGASGSGDIRYFLVDDFAADNNDLKVTSDYKYGLRRTHSNDASGTEITLLNITGNGWLLGLNQVNVNASTSRTAGISLTVNGSTAIYSSGYTTINAKIMRLVFGRWAFSGTYVRPRLAFMPLRFSQLQVIHQANSTDVYTECVYLLD